MMVSIRLLGEFALDIDGRPVPALAFSRRSAAALVKLLALAPSRRLHREQVMDALWPGLPPQDAANNLHKAAHYARRGTGVRGSVLLRNEIVALFPGAEVAVDAVEFEAAAAAAAIAADARAADSALAAYPGGLLPEDLYESWAAQPRQRLEVLHRELLRRAARWSELVALEPTDEQAHLGLAQSMLAGGDRAGALRQIDTIEQILRDELGIGLSPEGYDLRVTVLDSPVQVPPAVAGATGSAQAPRHASLATQALRFCRTGDGVRLAYATSGDGPVLVKAANWLTHLDYDWASPVWSPWWHRLSQGHRLVRYDERGSGLSDWDVPPGSFTLDAWVRDLETVADTMGLKRFALLGMSQGGPIAVRYAARHPERVSHLIVYGTCARATWARATDEERRELRALGELIKVSWGKDEPGFRQVYDARFLPDGPLEVWRAFDKLQRMSTSPGNAYRLWRAFGALDASADAVQLSVPTLILHSKDDQVWRFREAEELHSLVAGSRLVELDSKNHILRTDEPAFERLMHEVNEFLATDNVPGAARPRQRS
jgi:DNA-binding SARP family transcriptional activator/alpha-beta hydrolase superfamily lysophospholipase